MGLNLMSLLGQQSAGIMPTPADLEEQRRLEAELGMGQEQDRIVVEGNQAPQTPRNSLGPAAPDMANRSYLEAAAMANNDPLPEEVQRQRRGLFGVRGTLRDIIGIIGDSLSTANGGEAVYEPTRRRERLSDAMVGYTASPEAAMAAVERVTQIDPEAGRELYDQIQSDSVRRSQIEATQAQTQGVNDNRAATRANRFLQNSRRLLAAPEAFVDGALNPQAYRLLESIARQEGMTPADLGITPQMTQEEASMLAQTDLSMYQGESLKDRDQQLETGRYNAETGRINATRPRATPQARNVTQATEIARIRAAINRGERLPPGDQQTWDDERARTDRAAPRAVSSAPPASVTTRSGRTFTPRTN